VEISDERLANILRRKVRLNKPYVGVFLKKDDDNEAEIVTSAEDLHPVGTFGQVVEMQDLGSRLRIVVMGHRRIQLLTEAPEPEPDKQEDIEMTKVEAGQQEQPQQTTSPKLLMAETENEPKEEFSATDEMKALTQEVIKTIREIIALNPLYRESLQQMLHLGQRVVDNPVYLSDLGAALTGGDTEELADVLAERDVKKRLESSLQLLKKELELSKLQQKIGREVEDKVKNVQRKYLLQEQLKVIRKELGMEKDDAESIVEKYLARMEQMTVPKAVNDVIEEELSK